MSKQLVVPSHGELVSQLCRLKKATGGYSKGRGERV